MRMIMVSMVTTDDGLGNDVTTPTVINADCIRNFYPRKESRVGTRITFEDGGGWPITESYDDLKTKVADLGIVMTEFAMAFDAPAVIDEDTGEVINRADQAISKVSIQTEYIRCFYPRKDNKVGTRLTFAKGSGMAVANLLEEVAQACGAAPTLRIAAPAPGQLGNS